MKKKNILSITGCGSVPGIGNVMLRYAAEKFDKIEEIEAGFAWDSNMKKFVVPFSIQSILEEFTGKADFIKNHKWTYMMPSESLRIGKHRAIEDEPEFLVGHHPEPFTYYHYYKHKGVKNVKFYAGFPNHSYNTIKSFVELGFYRKTPIEFKGMKIFPDEYLTQVLKDLGYPKGYTEKENLWVHIYGSNNGKKKDILMECIVPTLKGWEDAGCNIDTGMPASIMAQMIKENIITAKGSSSPEGVVPPEPFFKELRKRKMIVYENGKVIN
jgi:lysine 6-dehydrogenase